MAGHGPAGYLEVDERTHRLRWLSMLFISVSLLIISLDNTILNVALPSISRDLGASQADLQWIVDSYVLVFAALLLTLGSLADRIGRKRLLQVGVLWFGVGSVAAALSQSTEVLIASRAFLGFGAAIIMPATLSIITATFADPKERSMAIALWAATFGLGIGIGPVVGGWLLEHYSWNAVFFLNVPVVIVSLVGGYFFISESRDEDAPRPDIPGVLLSITGLFALVYGIIEAGQDGWGAEHVIIAFGAAFVLLGAFAYWESHAEQPMLPLGFFKNMSFTGASVAISMVMFAMFGSFFFLSQYLQSVLGYTALETGVRLLPIAGTMVVVAPLSAKISERLGMKLTVGLGILIAASGMFYFSQIADADSSYLSLIPGFLILSAGMAVAMTPATDSIMGSVPVSKAGVGSAMNDTTRELGGALGVAVLGTLFNTVYLDRIGELIRNPALQAAPAEAIEAIKSSIQGAHIVAENIPVPDLAQVVVNSANAAFVSGMTEAMLIGSAVMLGASLFVFAFLPARIRRPQEQTVETGYEGSVLDTSEVAAVSGD